MAFPKFQTKEVLNKVLNAGENALQVDIISSSEHAEDDAHTSGDTGTFVLGVRQDSIAALGADGDYVPFQVNASGALYVEISSGGGEDAVYVDDADWSDGSSKHMLVGGLYQSSPQSITDGDVGPLQVNANGNLIIDVVNGGVLEGLVDGIETLLGTIDSDTDAIKTSLDNIDNSVDGNFLNVNMNLAGSDAQAGEGTISATTQRVTIATDDDGVAHLATIAGAVSTQMQVDVVAALPAGSNTIGKVDLGTTDNAVLDAIDAVLDTIKTDTGTIDSDTDAIKTATEASQASLADMIYGTAVAIDIDSGNHTSLTHNALYVGTGGNVKVNMGTSGTGITFSNVASGQILPIQITQVWQSGTTAEDMVALKE